jgi:hypothetical protein
MLLTRTYKLNDSQSKFIVVGIRHTENGFKRAIRIGKAAENNIVFNEDNWTTFLTYTNDIDEFFQGVKAGFQMQLVSEDHYTCIMSRYQFGKKLLCFSQIRRDSCSPKPPGCIFLREVSWKGLKNLKDLISFHMTRMKESEDLVNDAVRYIAARIIDKNIKMYPDFVDYLSSIDVYQEFQPEHAHKHLILMELCVGYKNAIWAFVEKTLHKIE